MSILSRLFGSETSRFLKETRGLVATVNNLEANLTTLSNEALAAKTAEFKNRLVGGATLDAILPEAFAVVRESSRRTLGQRHFDVQLLGGIALHQGRIAEMKTGEGKTLVATLPVYLNALTGRGMHVVTVNDYLARRDAAWMGQIYAFLGLSVGVINNQSSYLYDPSHTTAVADQERDQSGSYRVSYDFLRPATRHEAYLADITYGTNNEFGFDYLRDNIAYDSTQTVQRFDPASGHFAYAIIDEVDSILIDEARTPLIISAPVGKSESLYGTFARLSSQLEREQDFTLDEKLKAITLTDEGITKAEKILGISDIYTEKGVKYVHHLETAVRARALYERDRDYVVKNGEIVIVDEFTGRLQPGRRWSEGLHQAIEAKEGVDVKDESRTFATVTLQNYFRLYDKLGGMTGTAQTSAEEFLKVYNLPVVEIPTNRSSSRQDEPDVIFQTEAGKFTAITRTVKALQEKGQPVLVGTVSIEKNEVLSGYFQRAGVRHQILNAKNHEQEGQIIAAAGRPGSVVIATNMAGRGVDIKLGGAEPTAEEQEAIRALGGLYVLGTERHEARRIDNQLRGRSGRQGDPGQTKFFVSLEDSLMRVFAPERIKGLIGRLGLAEDEPIENRMISRAIESAQSKIEGLNFDARKHLLEYDDVMNYQRTTMYDRRRALVFGGEEAIQHFFDRMTEGWEPPARSEALAVLDERRAKLGADFAATLKNLILQVIDMYWVEHLEAIDYMRSSVRLRAYGQRDPLVEFKREGLRLFKQMERAIAHQVLETLKTMEERIKAPEVLDAQEIHQGAESLAAPRAGDQATADKVGRNDPCPCGSGKKYKKCHGK